MNILLTGTESDSHTWNLVYLQLLLEELGHRVHNLGPCVTDELLTAACAADGPGLVVISSVNGHGYRDGLNAVRALRREGFTGSVVIGGKLGVAGVADPGQRGRLLDAGCDAVFDDGDVNAFRNYLSSLSGHGHGVGPSAEARGEARTGARTGADAQAVA
ncbi:cobalamin B12-binding domain-containing protein [Streptomyces sp. NBC_01408]|nr:cobalamin B12-binding domain-containing protein [Streptomyces sp. NBC_01408]